MKQEFDLIDVSQAEELILKHAFEPVAVEVPLSKAVGRILLEEISADRDFPPFDRVMMDGIAIRHAEYRSGTRVFKIHGIQPAGAPGASLSEGTAKCMEVMTGAMLPVGSDTVIPYEWIEIKDGVASLKPDKHIDQGMNVHATGIDHQRGANLLYPGIQISSAEIGVLADVGKKMVRVAQNPKIAIVSTGDELVEVDRQPLPHQIRRSNVHALSAALKAMGITCQLVHLQDDRDSITAGIEALVHEMQVILLSGGVSKGKYDFVPEVLESLAINKVFHGVRQKPGKPFWFGAREDRKVVFAFPGNPVSTFMCFHRYFVPWLHKSLGSQPTNEEMAILNEDFSFGKDITYFLQVICKDKNGRRIAEPRKGGGSGDLANLVRADGFLELPPDRTLYKSGEAYKYISFR